MICKTGGRFEAQLEKNGSFSRTLRPPVLTFLKICGGDARAVELVHGRIVETLLDKTLHFPQVNASTTREKKGA